MNSDAMDYLQNSMLSENAVLQSFVNSWNIANLGIVKKVHNENYADVRLFFNDSEDKEIDILDVRLLRIGTDKCRVAVEVEEGDCVLVICPKDFVPKLEFDKKSEKSETFYSPYTVMGACAIPLNPEDDGHDAKVEITVAKDGKIKAKAKGDIELSSEGKVTIDGDGYGGMVKSKELKTQLDKATARIDAIIDALENSATGSQDGGSLYKTNITTYLTANAADKEDYKNIASDKFFQGDGSAQPSS